MSNEKKAKTKVTKVETAETLKALYYSGKVKPSLNKILIELKNDSENIELLLLACKCLERTKNYEDLAIHADNCIKLDPKNGAGYYYKGVAVHHKKGKEQEALKNLNEAIALEPENTIYLQGKATTHNILFTDYHLPIKFAEKHRDKARVCLFKIIEIIEQKENCDYVDYLTIADVCTLLSRNLDAKKYYIKAVDAYEAADKTEQDKNIYKDIIKAQKACVKLMDKIIED